MIIYYDKKKYEVGDNITAEQFAQKNEIKTKRELIFYELIKIK